MVEDDFCRDNGVIGDFWDRFEQELTEEQVELIESLSEVEIQEIFGNDFIVGLDGSLESFFNRYIPCTHTTTYDSPSWVTVFYHEDGGDIAWESFLPMLKKQNTGIKWLIAQTS